MHLAKSVSILFLSLWGSIAVADDVDCSNLDNDRARRECRQHKGGGDVNCNNLDNDRARRECREAKYGNGNGVDCNRIDDEDLRRECREEKWD